MIDKFLRRLVYEWCQRTFGQHVTHNTHDRSLRVIEEAVELAQVHNVNIERIHKLVDVVYSRPSGVYHREVGGVIVTLVVLCEACGYDIDFCAEEEIARILSTDPAVFRKRQAEKVEAGVV